MLPPLTLSTLALVVANLVPLAGAVLGLWTVGDLLLLYWAENVVVGLFQLLRMGSVMVLRGLHALMGVMVFFALHYGFFTFVHGMFVTSIFAPPEAQGMAAAAALLLSFDGLLFGLLALTASHGVSFVVNFLGAGEWRMAEATTLMKEPYARVVVLHLTILGGGWAVMALGEPLAALVVLVLVKIAVDLDAHRRQHLAAKARR